MVSDLIWAPHFFGPREIWFLRNLGPKNVGTCMNYKFHAGTKFLGAKIPQGPNFIRTKKVRGPNVIGDHFSFSPNFLLSYDVGPYVQSNSASL